MSPPPHSSVPHSKEHHRLFPPRASCRGTRRPCRHPLRDAVEDVTVDIVLRTSRSPGEGGSRGGHDFPRDLLVLRTTAVRHVHEGGSARRNVLPCRAGCPSRGSFGNASVGIRDARRSMSHHRSTSRPGHEGRVSESECTPMSRSSLEYRNPRDFPKLTRGLTDVEEAQVHPLPLPLRPKGRKRFLHSC